MISINILEDSNISFSIMMWYFIIYRVPKLCAMQARNQFLRWLRLNRWHTLAVSRFRYQCYIDYNFYSYNSGTGQSGRIVKLAINMVVRKYMCIKYYVGRGYA